MHSKLTFTDGVNGIYTAPLQEAVYEKYPAFFKEVLEEAEYTSNGDAVVKLPGVPQAAILALIHVLQHDALTVPPNAPQKLVFLANALIVGTTSHLDPMACQALQLFDEHLRKFPSPSNAAFAADFVAAVQAAYAPDPHPQKQFRVLLSQNMRVVRREHVPELKRLVVKYAAKRCEEMMGDEAYAALFADKECPFREDVLKAAKMKYGCGIDGDSDSYDVDRARLKKAVGVVDWDEFFGDERFVTIVDRKGKEWVTTRTKAFQYKRLLYFYHQWLEPGSTFGNAIHKLPDHPCGIEAVILMLEDGVRHFRVPKRIEQDARAAIEWLTNAMFIGYKYEITPMFEGVSCVLALEKYLDRCNEPHAIAKAVRVFCRFNELRIVGEENYIQLMNCFIQHFAEKSKEELRNGVYKSVLKQFLTFREDVRMQRLKMGHSEEDADLDDVVDEGVEYGEA